MLIVLKKNCRNSTQRLNLSLLFLALFINMSYCFSQADTTTQFGNINISFNNLGVLFSNVAASEPGFEVPAGSDLHTMYASRIWIGGLNDSMQLHLSGGRFGDDGSDFSAGPLDINGNSDSVLQSTYNQIHIANTEELSVHLSYLESLAQGNTAVQFPNGYTTPEWILNWPANNTSQLCYGSAPYIDYNLNGFYDPENGDYPCFRGDKCAYMIYNDNGGLHDETNGLPLKVTFHLMIYSYNNNSNTIANTVFVNCKMYNCSNEQYNNTHLGIWTDLDIGYNLDDFIGCNVRNAFYYGYNGDSLDVSPNDSVGYGLNTPIQAVVILGGPYFNADGIDNSMPEEIAGYTTYGPYGPGFNDGIIDNEQIGMSSFIYNRNTSHPINGEPIIPSDYYNYSRAIWRNNIPLLHGGDGVSSAGTTSISTSYAYPFTSDPFHIGTSGYDMDLWNAQIAGLTPFDKRGIAGCGPFDFDPGEEANLDLAYVFCDETGTGLSEFHYAELQVEQVRNFFISHNHECLELHSHIHVSESQSPKPWDIFPNPTSQEIRIRGLNNSISSYSIIDITGRTILLGSLNGADNINIEQIMKGEYILMLHDREGKMISINRIQKID
jgi:hypothetical protein